TPERPSHNQHQHPGRERGPDEQAQGQVGGNRHGPPASVTASPRWEGSRNPIPAQRRFRFGPLSFRRFPVRELRLDVSPRPVFRSNRLFPLDAATAGLESPESSAIRKSTNFPWKSIRATWSRTLSPRRNCRPPRETKRICDCSNLQSPRGRSSRFTMPRVAKSDTSTKSAIIRTSVITPSNTGGSSDFAHRSRYSNI